MIQFFRTKLTLNVLLYSACSNTMNQVSCTFSDEACCIVGTWVEDDFRKVVDMSYGVVDVFEFREYAVT